MSEVTKHWGNDIGKRHYADQEQYVTLEDYDALARQLAEVESDKLAVNSLSGENRMLTQQLADCRIELIAWKHTAKSQDALDDEIEALEQRCAELEAALAVGLPLDDTMIVTPAEMGRWTVVGRRSLRRLIYTIRHLQREQIRHQQEVEALQAQLAQVTEERDSFKKLWGVRGEALKKPCLQCGHKQQVVTTKEADLDAALAVVEKGMP